MNACANVCPIDRNPVDGRIILDRDYIDQAAGLRVSNSPKLWPKDLRAGPSLDCAANGMSTWLSEAHGPEEGGPSYVVFCFCAYGGAATPLRAEVIPKLKDVLRERDLIPPSNKGPNGQTRRASGSPSRRMSSPITHADSQPVRP